MDDRKFQQDYLSRKLKKSPERLAMNQGDGYRPKQEERQDGVHPSLLCVLRIPVHVGSRLIVPYRHWTMGKDVCDCVKCGIYTDVWPGFSPPQIVLEVSSGVSLSLLETSRLE